MKTQANRFTYLSLTFILLYGQFASQVTVSLADSLEEESLKAETAKVVTEDALTVAAGDAEIELTYSHSDSSNSFGSNNKSSDSPSAHSATYDLSITTGVSDTLDLGVTSGLSSLFDGAETPSSGTGLNDLGVRAKYSFFQCEEHGLYLAYLPGLVIPTGNGSSDRELGPSQEYLGVENMLALSVIDGQFNANADIGYSLPVGEDRESDRGTFRANTALGYQLLSFFSTNSRVRLLPGLRYRGRRFRLDKYHRRIDL